VVSVTSAQHQWSALLKVIGREDLIGDERFKDNTTRFKHLELVDRMVEEWTIKQTAYEAFHALARAGVPASITLNTAQVMNDPHFAARGAVVEIDHPVRGRMKTIECVPRLSDPPVEVRPAPLVGEHNAEIYGKLMGYGPKDLERLKGEGIIS
jgi:formyl-CoA transferase